MIEAAFRGARATATVLIEATCNQVNQEGGYTGMTPADFRASSRASPSRSGFPRDRLILGGDHLGPNPWKHLAGGGSDAAGGGHGRGLCRGRLRENPSRRQHGLPRRARRRFGDEVDRGARGTPCRGRRGRPRGAAATPPVYIIGTEVPAPGGALEVIEHLEVTDPAAAQTTYEVHDEPSRKCSSGTPFRGCLALSSSPASNSDTRTSSSTIRLKPATSVSRWISWPGLVFEAHSTDYQPGGSLKALVRDGFAILKVGPGLTFALREALYALEHIAAELCPASLANP